MRRASSSQGVIAAVGEEALMGNAPLRRLGGDEDLKGAALLFASDAGSSEPGRANRKGATGVSAKASTRPRITAPASGTIIALDPDIPADHQRLTFRAEGEQLRWQMDGKPFARGPQVQWLPWPGRHVVQLTDARGATLDEIRLEVRGAGVRSQASR